MKMLLTAALILSGMAAQAAPADQETVTLECRSLESFPDHSLAIQILQGGITGLTTLRVEDNTVAGPMITNYIVRAADMRRRPMGAPMVYKGKGVQLSVNFTTSPARDGGRIGQLIRTDKSGHIRTDEVICHSVR